MTRSRNTHCLLYTAIAAVGLWGCGGDVPVQEEGKKEKSFLVAVDKAAFRELSRRITVRGTVRSRFRAAVSARVPGILERLPVEAGDPVTAGKTLLFMTEKRKYQEALAEADAGVERAGRGLAEARAAVKAAIAAEAKARRDRERMERLFAAEEPAVTEDLVEQAQLAWRTRAAELERARAVVEGATAALEQARRRRALAAEDLADCTVTAPLDGVVARKRMERGELARVGDRVVEVEDPGRLEVTAFIEAGLYDGVVPGKTLVELRREREILHQAPLTWKAPVVRRDLRVFEIRLHLPRGAAFTRSGRMVELELILERRRLLSFPAGALQSRGGKEIIFTVKDGKARRIVLEPLIIDGGLTGVAPGELAEGDPVVVRGQSFLEEGHPVRLGKER